MKAQLRTNSLPESSGVHRELTIDAGVAGTPGTRLYRSLVVSDIVKARAELVARDVQVSEVSHRVALGKPNVPGPHPERQSYSSFASFNDPDGNTWVMQEVTARLPGRVDSTDTTFSIERAPAPTGSRI